MFRNLARPALGGVLATTALYTTTTSPSLCETPKDPSLAQYYNFPAAEKFTPKVPYPLWDVDWDGRLTASKTANKYVPGPGVTRHVILIRHGQYVEDYKEDELRILTPLGREQARLTGERLAKMIGNDKESQAGNITVKVVHVSDMARAKETADIMVSSIESSLGITVPRSPPNPDLNEGRPCHIIPSGRPFSSRAIERDSPRIERAFKHYFYRHIEDGWEEVAKVRDATDRAQAKVELEKKLASPNLVESESRVETLMKRLEGGEQEVQGKTGGERKKGEEKEKEKEDNPAADATRALAAHRHEYEVIVCHGNVIRYFFMRALQLPPEAWLRLCTFNCSLTYFTIRPTGGVSCRMLGDTGHMDMEHTTFSGHHGFNW